MLKKCKEHIKISNKYYFTDSYKPKTTSPAHKRWVPTNGIRRSIKNRRYGQIHIADSKRSEKDSSWSGHDGNPQH